MKTSGIYQIKNLLSDAIYVGASTNVPSRWRAHRNNLKANRHINKSLQADWNKHGSTAFEFSVLEQTGTLDLFERERHWIDILRTEEIGYNKLAGRPAEMEGGKRVNVYLDAESLRRAALLGKGNVSEGIRMALAPSD